MGEWMLWDCERGMWWAPGMAGYAMDRADAGLYTDEQMAEVVKGNINPAYATIPVPLWNAEVWEHFMRKGD